MLGMCNVSNNVNTSVKEYIWYLNAVNIEYVITTMTDGVLNRFKSNIITSVNSKWVP